MRKLIALLLASSLAGCTNDGGEPPGTPVPNMYPGSEGVPVGAVVLCDRPLLGQQLYTAPVLGAQIPGATPLYTVYHATLPNGSLICGYWDAIHWPPQPLKIGNADPASGASGTVNAPAADGARALSLTAPPTIDVDDEGNTRHTASVGLFSTGVDFGPRAVFAVRATFQNPCGPHLAEVPDGLSNAWAVTVAAREGDETDLATDKRLGVTFKVKEHSATLTVQESDASGQTSGIAKTNVDSAIYDAIFGGNPETCADPHPAFTLTLYVNRQTGSGVASLTGPAVEAAKKPSQDLRFNMQAAFQSTTSGPLIETVGVTLANCCSEGQRVYVEVTDFEIKQLLRSPFGPFEPNVPNSPPINPLRR